MAHSRATRKTKMSEFTAKSSGGFATHSKNLSADRIKANALERQRRVTDWNLGMMSSWAALLITYLVGCLSITLVGCISVKPSSITLALTGSTERFLEWVAEPLEPLVVNSDVFVILEALLCAIICVVGLALVACCPWLRHADPPSPLLNKGPKKSAMQALPKVSFDRSSSAAAGGRLAHCTICLAEFAEGDEVRLLLQCGHGFHAGCVDKWLRSHSSCPFCRQVLVVSAPPSRCQRCGASSEPEVSTAAASAESGTKAWENGGATSFLP